MRTVDSCSMPSCAPLLAWSTVNGTLTASCHEASAKVARPWHTDIVHAAATPLQDTTAGL